MTFKKSFSLKNITNNRISWIDGLKGLAMLLILMMHTGSDKGVHIFGMYADKFFLRLGGNGWIGVVLFFLLSGFLSYHSLYAYFKNADYSLKTVTAWIKYRFIRLIPLFYLAVLIGFLWHEHYLWLGSLGYPKIKNLIINLLFIHGFFPNYCANILGIEWYVGVLAIFICLVPFIFKIVNSLNKSLVLFAISVVITYFMKQYLNSLTPVGIHLPVYKNFVNAFSIIENFSTLCLGIVLFYLYQYITNLSVCHKIGISYVLMMVSFVLLYQNLYAQSTFLLMNTHTVWALCFALLIISQMIHENFLICNLVFKFIGRYSWPIYLFHFFLIDLYRKNIAVKTNYPMVNWVIEFVFIVVCCCLLSFVLTKYIDRPLISFLSRHSNAHK